MVIDILEIERAIGQYDSGRIHVNLRFEGQFIFICVTHEDLKLDNTVRFSFEALRVADITLKELVDSIVEDFKTEVSKHYELIRSAISYEPELAGYDILNKQAKSRWIHFGDFINGKGFYCSNCGHRVYVLDDDYPNEKICPNCRHVMGTYAIEKYDYIIKDVKVKEVKDDN